MRVTTVPALYFGGSWFRNDTGNIGGHGTRLLRATEIVNRGVLLPPPLLTAGFAMKISFTARVTGTLYEVGGALAAAE